MSTKNNRIPHPPAPQAAAAAATGANAATTAAPLTDTTGAGAAAAAADLPQAWKRYESKSQPGSFYYVSPLGHSQWQHPGTDADRIAASAIVSKDAINSLYRVNYKRWDNARLFNPGDLNQTGGKASKSYALHPKAQHDESFFVSLNRRDYVDHHVRAQVHHKEWPVQPRMEPFESNSTYRSDFTRYHSKRPKSARTQSPPLSQPFGHNSTSRSDFVDFHPKRPRIVKPEHKLHFNMGTAINSLYRQNFVDHSKSCMFGGKSLKLSRYHEDAGWKDGLNRCDEDHYKSLYQRDFVEGADIGVPPIVRRNSQTIDKSIVRRQKTIAGLKEVD